jgi:hypothetical protein
MNSRLYILMLGLLLCARPALAESDTSFVWDLNVANAVGASMTAAACRPNPYVLDGHGCSIGELSISVARSEEPRLSTLDRIALFLDRHKDLNLDTDLHSSTKLKFSVGLANLYSQEAKARIELRIRF